MEIKSISIDFLSVGSCKYVIDKTRLNKFSMIKYSPYFCIDENLGDDLLAVSGDGEPSLFKKNEFLICPSNKRHLDRIATPDKVSFHFLRWFYADIVINGKYKLDDLYDFPQHLPYEYCEQMSSIMSEIIMIPETEEYLCDRLSLAYKIIKILLKVGTEKQKIDKNILKAVDYIKKNYSHDISISTLAKVANMSESNFFRVFKKHMNITPTAYINDYRLVKSSVLLETTDKKLSEISRSVGFNEQYYFSKLFLQKFGISPLKYRNLTTK